MQSFFDRPIEFLKGVGPQRAESLNKELNIFNFGDLLQHYPFRHEDRSKFYPINELDPELPYIQIIGEFRSFATIGGGRKTRLVGKFYDETGDRFGPFDFTYLINLWKKHDRAIRCRNGSLRSSNILYSCIVLSGKSHTRTYHVVYLHGNPNSPAL